MATATSILADLIFTGAVGPEVVSQQSIFVGFEGEQ
jgi:hypothetical protein